MELFFIPTVTGGAQLFTLQLLSLNFQVHQEVLGTTSPSLSQTCNLRVPRATACAPHWGSRRFGGRSGI